MVSFESDYNNGCVPEILERLAATNDERTTGYGFDEFCLSAKKKIRKACGLDDAEIFFLSGGTQTNSTVLDAVITRGDGIIALPTAHIYGHEAGAIEAYGHKIICVDGHDGKLLAQDLQRYMDAFLADETRIHMVQPEIVYITFPTELGGLYSLRELTELYATCRRYHLLLYVDGARLGYGLASPANDITLKDLAHNCDVFYIGGTKVGALMGEAVVFSNIKPPRAMFTIIKYHGAVLAKGRLLGLQFDTLFTDDLYMRISKHAIDMAEKLVDVFKRHGYEMAYPSPTNQQFVIMTREQKERLEKTIAFEVWSHEPDGRLQCRFVTSWSTTEADIKALDEAL